MATAAPPNASHYGHRVIFSVEDDEFVATCLEFPSLSWLATTQKEALAAIRRLVAEVINDLRATGAPIPGLYAIGEVAEFGGGGGMNGNRTVEGTLLGGRIFTARELARQLP